MHITVHMVYKPLCTRTIAISDCTSYQSHHYSTRSPDCLSLVCLKMDVF